MSFKFIVNTNTSPVAIEADTLSELDLGGVFHLQTKKDSFQIGNTGATTATYDITISGSESAITVNAKLSLDDQTYASTIGVSGLAPNAVSDLIYTRFIPDASTITTSGVYLIRVDES